MDHDKEKFPFFTFVSLVNSISFGYTYMRTESCPEREESTVADTYLQVRTDSKEKEEATKILEELGTNVSQVVNMLLKQIILKQQIPFDMDLNTKKAKSKPESEKILQFKKVDSSDRSKE